MQSYHKKIIENLEDTNKQNEENIKQNLNSEITRVNILEYFRCHLIIIFLAYLCIYHLFLF